jgi:4-diphosphocytidyl-2-C-methyl-D-erythritol kinase
MVRGPSAIRKIVPCRVKSGRIPANVSAAIPAPAKVNLFLAVTGRRKDGFHDLLSLAAPLVWGDSMTMEPAGSSFTVECDDPGVPTDANNLVIKAAEAFAKATGWKGGARFTIKKKIPFGAGLGGASSDATSALVALNRLAGGPLDDAGLAGVASSVGSDCALFLANSPVIMRGRGERVEPLAKDVYRRIRGARIIIFKPGFAVPTAWAYGKLAADAPRSYVSLNEAEAKLALWISKPGAPVAELLYNSMEAPVFAKFGALPTLIAEIGARFGIACRMSGSGSACFALLNESANAAPVEAAVRTAWGPSAFFVETRIA